MAELPGFFEIVSIEGPLPEDTYDILNINNGVTIVTFDANAMHSTAMAQSTFNLAKMYVGPSFKIDGGSIIAKTHILHQLITTVYFNRSGERKYTASASTYARLVPRHDLSEMSTSSAYTFAKMYVGRDFQAGLVVKNTSDSDVDRHREMVSTAIAKSLSSGEPFLPDTWIRSEARAKAGMSSKLITDIYISKLVSARSIVSVFPELDTYAQLENLVTGKTEASAELRVTKFAHLDLSILAKNTSEAKLKYQANLSGTATASATVANTRLFNIFEFDVTLLTKAKIEDLTLHSTLKLEESILVETTSHAVKLKVFGILKGSAIALVSSPGRLAFEEEFEGTCTAKASSKTAWLENLSASVAAKAFSPSDLDANLKYIYGSALAKMTSTGSLHKIVDFICVSTVKGLTLKTLHSDIYIEPVTLLGKNSSYSRLSYREDVSSNMLAKNITSSHVSLIFHLKFSGVVKAYTLEDFDAFLDLGKITLTVPSSTKSHLAFPFSGLRSTATAKAVPSASVRVIYSLTSTVFAKSEFKIVFGPQFFATATGSSKSSAYLGISLLRNLNRLWFEIYES